MKNFRYIIVMLLSLLYINGMMYMQEAHAQVSKEIQEQIKSYRAISDNGVKNVKLTGNVEWITTRNGKYRAAIYYPKNIKPNEPLPVFFDIHGGGFVSGTLEKDEGMSRLFSDNLNICVISLEYGLAPEHPYPQATDDIYDMINYFVKNSDKYKIDVNNMAIGGHSAGANLATVTAMRAKADKSFSFKCEILDYPPLDLAKNPYTKPIIEGAIPPDRSVNYNASYCTPEQSVDPYCSPVFATKEQLEGMPPAIILVCGIDSLKDEGIQYANKLIDAGVEVTIRLFPNSRHGFTTQYGNEDAKQGHQMMLEGLKKYLNR